MSNQKTEFRRVNRDYNFTHAHHTDVMKLPRYKSIATVGDEPGMEGDVILDRSCQCLCYHNGITWVCLDGSFGQTGPTGSIGPTGPFGGPTGPGGCTGPTGPIGPTGAGFAISNQSWSFATQSSGEGHVGGFYIHASGANNFSTSITFGIANRAYGAHFYVVTGPPPAQDDITTIDITGTSQNTYFETTEKWLGQISIIVNGGTARSCNYGYAKYWDNGNTNFTVVGIEATWIGGSNTQVGTDTDIRLLHHRGGTDNWQYNAGGIANTTNNIIASMYEDYNPDHTIGQNVDGAWKRVSPSTGGFGLGFPRVINGNDSEGTIIEFNSNNNSTFKIGTITIQIQQ